MSNLKKQKPPINIIGGTKLAQFWFKPRFGVQSPKLGIMFGNFNKKRQVSLNDTTQTKYKCIDGHIFNKKDAQYCLNCYKCQAKKLKT